jgi:hypothetical protein
VFNAHDREVPTVAIGQLVIDRLRRLDQVAYVRFASVYRQFKTLEELVEEARTVIDARRYEDPPGQGRLFVEASGAQREQPAGTPETEEGAAGAGRRRRQYTRRVNGGAPMDENGARADGRPTNAGKAAAPDTH